MRVSSQHTFQNKICSGCFDNEEESELFLLLIIMLLTFKFIHDVEVETLLQHPSDVSKAKHTD